MSEQPQGTVQVAGKIAEQVVNGLRAQPMMLGLIVLNCIGLFTAVWFLNNLIDVSKENFQIVLKACLQQLQDPKP